MKTRYDTLIAELLESGEQKHVEGLRIFRAKREGYLACLQSPEVTALRTALEAVADGDITDGQLCWCHGTTEHEAFCLQARAALAPWTEGAGQPVGKGEA